MTYYCLRSKEVRKILLHIVGDGDLDGDLSVIMDAAQDWEIHAVCLSIFLARHVDGRGHEMIDGAYGLRDYCDFEIQEGDRDFIEHMLKYERLGSEMLDDALISVQEDWSRRCYERTLRY